MTSLRLLMIAGGLLLGLSLGRCVSADSPTPALRFDPNNLPHESQYAFPLDDWVVILQQGTIGWGFEVTSPVELTHLGVFDRNGDGLPASHHVGLWRDGELLSSATVLSGEQSERVGLWRAVEVDPIELPPGSYVIGSAQLPTAEFFDAVGGLFSEEEYINGGVEIFDQTIFGRPLEDWIPSSDWFGPSEQFFWSHSGSRESVQIDSRLTIDDTTPMFSGVSHTSLGPGGIQRGFREPTGNIAWEGVFAGPNLFVTPLPEPTSAFLVAVALLWRPVRRSRS